MEKREPSCTMGGDLHNIVNWYSHCGEQYGDSLKKLGIKLPYDSAIPLLGIYPVKTIIEKDTCTLMFIAALFTIAMTQKQLEARRQKMDKAAVVCIYNGILLSHKKNEFDLVLVRWMNLEPVMKREVSQKEKTKYGHMCVCVCVYMHWYMIFGIYMRYTYIQYQFSSATQLCPTLCNPWDCSMLAFPVHHQLPEPTQTHVHHVSDAIQPPHPLSSLSPPTFNLSQHQGLFQWVGSSHQMAKVLEFQL